MDQTERYSDEAQTFRLALENWQTRMWTAIPCVVTAFPSASGISQMMLDAQPQIAATYLNASGVEVTTQMPLLVDIPVLWQGGGGGTLTFPIKPGDECLVIFASRCIDLAWKTGPGTAEATGDIVPPPDARMHNLSDGFAIVGVRSLPREFAVDPNTVQLRSDDDAAIISIDPNSHDIEVSTTDGNVDVVAGQGDINLTTSAGQVNANGVTIDKNGNMSVPGNIICAKTITGQQQVVAGQGGSAVHLTTHNHPTAPSGPISPPTPGS